MIQSLLEVFACIKGGFRRLERIHSQYMALEFRSQPNILETDHCSKLCCVILLLWFRINKYARRGEDVLDARRDVMLTTE